VGYEQKVAYEARAEVRKAVTQPSTRETYSIFKMTIKGFYLVGQSKDVFHQDIHIDQYHDFEALQVAVAEQYNVIQATGTFCIRHLSINTDNSCRHWTAR
jgi:hypothetical protein